MRKYFIGYINAANFLTTLGLTLSLAGCLFSFGGEIDTAVVFLIAAGLCDLFDGAVARMLKLTEEEKSFGIQLDTLADVVSFGIAPVVIAFNSGITEWYAAVIYLFYICCAVTRLAYFNSIAYVSADKSKGYYHGLPVTYISLVFPLVFLAENHAVRLAMFAAMSLLYILDIKIPKPKGIWYIIFPLFAIIMAAIWIVYLQ